MGKFREIARGNLDIDRAPIEFIDGTTDTIGLRLLLGSEEDAILTAARTAAVQRGVTDPKDGNPIYDAWVARYTVFHAAVDPDEGHRAESYFESAEQILHNLDDDRVVYLAERQRTWQDARSPRLRSLNRDQYIGAVLEIATAGEGEDLPFERWHPALRKSFLRISCSLLLNSPGLKSASGLDSVGSTKNSSPDAGSA